MPPRKRKNGDAEEEEAGFSQAAQSQAAASQAATQSGGLDQAEADTLARDVCRYGAPLARVA